MRGERLEVRISSFHNLRVYQISFKLAIEMHKMTRSFPDFEKYELAAQIRRAAVSIPANIAEGYGRKNSIEVWK